VLLLFDDLHEVTLLTLLHFYCINITLDLLLEVATGHIHVLAVLLLNGAVLGLAEHLFLILLSLSLLSLLLHFHIPLPRNEYIISPLLCLIKLLPRLLLLLLQQRDPIGQQLVVFLRPLPRDLGRDQLAVQRLIVVILVHVQVHLVGGRELRTVQLVIQVVVVVILVLLLLGRRVDVVWVLARRLLVLVMGVFFFVVGVPLVFLVITTTA
jgi:hypothetical protein